MFQGCFKFYFRFYFTWNRILFHVSSFKFLVLSFKFYFKFYFTWNSGLRVFYCTHASITSRFVNIDVLSLTGSDVKIAKYLRGGATGLSFFWKRKKSRVTFKERCHSYIILLQFTWRNVALKPSDCQPDESTTTLWCILLRRGALWQSRAQPDRSSTQSMLEHEAKFAS